MYPAVLMYFISAAVILLASLAARRITAAEMKYMRRTAGTVNIIFTSVCHKLHTTDQTKQQTANSLFWNIKSILRTPCHHSLAKDKAIQHTHTDYLQQPATNCCLQTSQHFTCTTVKNKKIISCRLPTVNGHRQINTKETLHWSIKVIFTVYMTVSWIKI